ncbi:hypothetical protein ACFQZQ_14705 [Lysobacter koreensis]|uniref:Secreted protein n=1 Tax=Lysobacter koreensis TaxID=266122 RepID=A0ABW2YQ01_9GAMM
MRKFAVALPLLLLSGWAAAQDCAGLAVSTAAGARPAMAAAVAPELASPNHKLGAPSGVLAQAYDEAQSVDNVLLRMRIEKCQSVAAGKNAPTAPASSADPAAYKPLTKHDNSPWRFDMSQNGKRMTAEEFDAWMKSRGVRVAKGAPAKAAAPAPEENKAK